MGKSKQKRFKVRASPPTGLPSVKDFEAELEATAATSSTLQPIKEQLSSVNEETRECACASIANLVSTPANIGPILQNDCIKILAPLFVDKSPQVSVKAVGAVRNISVDGGVEACELLVKKDVLTPLVVLFGQKAFKRDFKVHKIASKERMNKLMESSLSQNDDRLIKTIDSVSNSYHPMKLQDRL